MHLSFGQVANTQARVLIIESDMHVQLADFWEVYQSKSHLSCVVPVARGVFTADILIILSFCPPQQFGGC